MKVPKHRLMGVIVGAVIALLSLDSIERYRATQSPSGWHRSDDVELPRHEHAWKIGNSAWRLGPGTTWTSEKSHEQAYIRPIMKPDSRVGITLSNHQAQPLWIWYDGQGLVTAKHKGETISCMGRIPPNTNVTAIELKRSADGLMVTRGDVKMICPTDDATEQPIRLKVEKEEVQLLAIGRDRKADGVPLSPLWWMSGLMGLVFLWMILFDVVVGTLRSLVPKSPERPARPTRPTRSEE